MCVIVFIQLTSCGESESWLSDQMNKEMPLKQICGSAQVYMLLERYALQGRRENSKNVYDGGRVREQFNY